MSLAGLLSAIADDPQFRQVAELASVDDGGVVPVARGRFRHGPENFLRLSPLDSQKHQATLWSRDTGEREPRGELDGRGNRSRPQAHRGKAARPCGQPGTDGEPSTGRARRR